MLGQPQRKAMNDNHANVIPTHSCLSPLSSAAVFMKGTSPWKTTKKISHCPSIWPFILPDFASLDISNLYYLVSVAMLLIFFLLSTPHLPWLPLPLPFSLSGPECTVFAQYCLGVLNCGLILCSKFCNYLKTTFCVESYKSRDVHGPGHKCTYVVGTNMPWF